MLVTVSLCTMRVGPVGPRELQRGQVLYFLDIYFKQLQYLNYSACIRENFVVKTRHFLYISIVPQNE